jgi:hypothetical protein
MGGACSTYGGEERRIRGFWWGNLNGKNHFKGPDVDGMIILRRIFRKWDVGTWTGSSWLKDMDRWRGTCECGNEPLGSIKYGEFLD